MPRFSRFQQARLRDVPQLALTAALDLGLTGRARVAGAALCWLPLATNMAGHALSRDTYCTAGRTTFVIVNDDPDDEFEPWLFAVMGVSVLGHALAAAGIAALTTVTWLGWPLAAVAVAGVTTATVVLHRRFAAGDRARSAILSLLPVERHLVLRRLTSRDHENGDDVAICRAVQDRLITPGSLVMLIAADDRQAHRARTIGFMSCRQYPTPIFALRSYEVGPPSTP